MNKANDHRNTILSTVILFLFIYSIPFKGVPFAFGKVFAIVGSVHYIMNIETIKFNKNNSKIFLFLILLFFFNIASFCINFDYFDVQGIYDFFIYVFEIVIGSWFVSLLLFRLNCKVDFFKLIILICFIQSFFIILMFTNVDIRYFIYSLQSVEDELLILNKNTLGYRGFGFSINTLTFLSIFQTLALFLIVYNINSKVSRRQVLIYCFCYLIIMLSSILVARSSIIGIVLSFVYIFLKSFNYIFGKRKYRNIFRFIWTLIIIITLFMIIFLIFFDIESSMKFFEWAFELFINLLTGKSFSTGSTSELKNMYFPLSIKTFLLGDGNVNLKYHINTDSGYMRSILFYGIGGSTFFYIYNLLILISIYNLRDKAINDKNIIFLIAIYLFILEIKGNVFNSTLIMKFLFLWLFIFTKRKKCHGNIS